ncbi:hypothetical protein [Pseudomonas shahriarae]
MRRIFRTLLLVDNKTETLIYGHTIEWILSDLDYNIKKWKTFSTGSISVYFKDIEDILEVNESIRAGVFDLSPDQKYKIHFDFPESEYFFIEKSYDEENFSPFINLCSFAEVHFRDLPTTATNPVDYLQAQKETFDIIREKFQVDLIKSPHLLDTFTIFTPTRLEEIFRGLKDENVVGYEVALVDYFNLYKGAVVNLESTDETNSHVTTFNLDNEMHQINSGFVPDKQVTTVILDGITIYRSSFGLIKKINVNANIIEQKNIRYRNRTIQQTTSTRNDFDV